MPGHTATADGACIPLEELPDGTTATFTAGEEGTFIDDQTGSTWNLLGEAIDGELEGSRLIPVPLDDTFWFVWFAFQPDTDTIGGEALDA